MAKLISVVDDIDLCSEATQTIVLGYGRKEYELDLSDENATQLDAEITWWINHGRPRGAPAKPISRPRQSDSDPEPVNEWWRTPPDASAAVQRQFHEMRQEIREWGRHHGYPSLGDRGILPRSLYAKWQAYQPGHPVMKHRAEPEPDTTDDADAEEEQQDQQLSGLDVEPKFSDGKAKPKRTTRTRVKVAS